MTDADKDALFGKDLRVYGTKMNKQTLPDIIEIDGVKYVKVVEEPEELKTLYQMLNEEEFRDDICSVVKEWMSQYTHNVMTGEYLKGYEECLTVLGENLK